MATKLSDRLKAVPEGTPVGYSVRPPNKPIRVYGGIFGEQPGLRRTKVGWKAAYSLDSVSMDPSSPWVVSDF